MSSCPKRVLCAHNCVLDGSHSQYFKFHPLRFSWPLSCCTETRLLSPRRFTAFLPLRTAGGGGESQIGATVGGKALFPPCCSATWLRAPSAGDFIIVFKSSTPGLQGGRSGQPHASLGPSALKWAQLLAPLFSPAWSPPPPPNLFCRRSSASLKHNWEVSVMQHGERHHRWRNTWRYVSDLFHTCIYVKSCKGWKNVLFKRNTWGQRPEDSALRLRVSSPCKAHFKISSV